MERYTINMYIIIKSQARGAQSAKMSCIDVKVLNIASLDSWGHELAADWLCEVGILRVLDVAAAERCRVRDFNQNNMNMMFSASGRTTPGW